MTVTGLRATSTPIVSEADDLIAAGDHESAIAVLEQALTTADPDDHIGRSLLHGRLAIGHFYRRDIEGIREHAEAAIDLVADDPDAPDVYADALAARALYLGESGQTQAYLETSQTELAVRRELPPAESEVSSPLVNIALARGESGDFEAAERYLREALAHALEYEADTIRPTLIRTNLAWVYGMRKEYRAAVRLGRAVDRDRPPETARLGRSRHPPIQPRFEPRCTGTLRGSAAKCWKKPGHCSASRFQIPPTWGGPPTHWPT